MRFPVLKWHFLSSLHQLLFLSFPWLLLCLHQKPEGKGPLCSPASFPGVFLVLCRDALQEDFLSTTQRVCASGAEQLWPAWCQQPGSGTPNLEDQKHLQKHLLQ